MIYDINGALISDYNPIGLHEKPKSEGQLNAVKRARQMTDITWIPAGTFDRTEFVTPGKYPGFPKIDFVDEFTAGKEYVGVPYSASKRVGTDVKFDTFVTATHTPNSAQMLESSYDPSPEAGGYKAAFYGSTCVNLTGYALDLPYVTSGSYPTYPGMQYRYKVIDGGVVGNLDEDLELADILQISGHCAIVTDIMRDSNGSVTHVEVSEAVKGGEQNISHKGGEWGGKAQRVMWELSSFLTRFGGYTVYRYQYMDTIKYYESVYVPMVDEGKPYAIIDYPILPYYGDKAIINSTNGTTVKLLINSTAFTHAAIYKNGTQFGNLIELNGASYIDVSCPQEMAEYEAFLVNLADGEMNERTFGSHWYTVPSWATQVSVSGNTATVTVTMPNSEFYPWAVIFGTATSIAGRYARRVFEYTKNEGSNSTVYTFTSTVPVSSPTRVEINMRSNTYGNVKRTFTI